MGIWGIISLIVTIIQILLKLRDLKGASVARQLLKAVRKAPKEVLDQVGEGLRAAAKVCDTQGKCGVEEDHQLLLTVVSQSLETIKNSIKK